MSGILLPFAFFDFVNAPAWVKPFWHVGWGGIAAFAVLALLFAMLQLAFPKLAAIAWTTGKEAVLQPLFYILLGFGIFVLILSLYLPYFTFGEDTKVVEENGLTLVMLLSVILGLWTASVSLADEIEGRTALTVLCKPISRRDFVLGKFLGILGPVAILFIVLGVVFLASVSFKVLYDARETSQPEPNSQQCLQEVDAHRPGPGPGLFRNDRDGLDQRGHLHAAGNAAEPGDLLFDLRVGASRADAGQIGHGADGDRHLHRRSPGSRPARAGALQYLWADCHGRKRSPGLSGLAALYCLAYSSLAMLAALLMFEDRDLA